MHIKKKLLRPLQQYTIANVFWYSFKQCSANSSLPQWEMALEQLLKNTFKVILMNLQ